MSSSFKKPPLHKFLFLSPSLSLSCLRQPSFSLPHGPTAWTLARSPFWTIVLEDPFSIASSLLHPVSFFFFSFLFGSPSLHIHSISSPAWLTGQSVSSFFPPLLRNHVVVSGRPSQPSTHCHRQPGLRDPLPPALHIGPLAAVPPASSRRPAQCPNHRWTLLFLRCTEEECRLACR